MLDWCRNQPQPNQSKSELIFTMTGNPLPPAPKHPPAHPPPRFALIQTPLVRKLNPHPRRGIKTHFHPDPPSVACDKQIQVELEPLRKVLVDSATQTHRLLLPSRGRTVHSGSLACSREHSPAKPKEISFLAPPQRYNPPTTLASKWQGETNRETKASNCLIDTKDRHGHLPPSDFKNIESYHLSKPNEYPSSPAMQRERSGLSELQQPSREDSSESLTFSTKYRQMLRNVQSEFKTSQHKNLRQTPNRRILFHDRDTIISRDDHRTSERSYRVEESLLYEPEIRSLFTPLTPMVPHGHYCMGLAVENLVNMVVSIKEMAVGEMDRISGEMLVHRELEGREGVLGGVLQLYQTQIDHGTYIFIKEAYTETMESYIARGNDAQEVLEQVREILQAMAVGGFVLRGVLTLPDLVVVLGRVKIHSAGLFVLERGSYVDYRGVLAHLQREMEAV